MDGGRLAPSQEARHELTVKPGEGKASWRGQTSSEEAERDAACGPSCACRLAVMSLTCVRVTLGSKGLDQEPIAVVHVQGEGQPLIAEHGRV